MTENIKGLTTAEVAERVAQGKVNTAVTLKTKSIKRILYDNICTLFNLINIILFVSLLMVGSFKNMLFIGVVFFNTIIGIVQEIRSKRSVDRLTILTETKAEVLRDGKTTLISKEELVLDDIIYLTRGNQIPADCVLISGSSKVNESLLTGESDLIEKTEGDKLLSGSFVSAGKCCARVTRVGADAYAAKINSEAKYIKKNNSQIMSSFKYIIKICTIIIFPLGALLFGSQFLFQHANLQQSVISTVAALVGMIPGGMILLTSSVLAVSIIRLSHKKVLVNEMYCIETLARVDVLCLDKTGTLTADAMHVSDIICMDADEEEIKTVLASICQASEDINATLQAIKDYTEGVQSIASVNFTPFSSETKWSGGTFADHKTYIIGAAEFVFSDKEKYKAVFNQMEAISDTVRILVLARSSTTLHSQRLPDDLTPMAFILIRDTLRENVNRTIDYFKNQGVTLKVISGDSVQTVRNIACETGIEGAELAVDMTEITTDKQLAEAAERCNIFGRVTPAQKKKLILALKAHGHTVAMTGDGVNDVLALKEADCSVAMASGSEAARNVSQLVLVDNDFAAMPEVVAEGRRTINNIERSSSLYLVKTIYSILLSFFFIFTAITYPFEPIQLTLIGALTIAFPSFVLALQPNNSIVRGNFTRNIIARALPAAGMVFLNIVSVVMTSAFLSVSHEEFSTISVSLTALVCMLLVIRLSLPLNVLRTGMLVVSGAGLTIAFVFFGELFNLVFLSSRAIALISILAVLTIVVFNLFYNIADHYIQKDKNKPFNHDYENFPKC